MTTISTSADDAQLLRTYVTSRDAAAFAELVRRHAGLVFATARRVTGSAADAEDVAQQCFMELARRAAAVRASVPAWLHAVATRQATTLVRRRIAQRRRERAAMDLPGPDSAAQQWAQIEPLVDQAIAQLDDELRQPVVLHYLKGIHQQQLAAMSGVDQSTISRRIDRGVAAIRQFIDQRSSGAASALPAATWLSAVHPTDAPAALVESLAKIALAGVQPATVAAGAITTSISLPKLLPVTLAAVLLVVGIATAIHLQAPASQSGGSGASTSATHVPSTAENRPMAANVVRDGDRVFIRGLENAQWGGETERQDSGLACVTEVLRVLGHDVSYEQVMGLGGSAFRVQMTKGKMLPESPNAGVGRKTIAPALAAFGYRAELIMPHGQDTPEVMARVKTAVVENVNRGIPLLYGHREWSIIVGYQRDGEQMLVRPYSPQQAGYEPPAEPPWEVYAIVKSDAPAPAYRDAVLASLGAAVEMANTPEYDNLHSGFAAYKNWAARLRSPDVEMDEMLGNGYTYGSLWNQRDMASRYLNQVADEFPPDAAEHLRRAAAHYHQIYAVMTEQRPDLRHPWMYMPWDLRGEWTPQQREAQAAMLDEITEIEQQAIHEIELAITSTPTTRMQTAAEPPSPTAGQ